MVEIGGRPILWHIMKIYAHYGYKDFILALGYKGDIIRDYFLNYHTYNNDFTVNLGKQNGIEIYGNHDEHDWKVTLAETGKESMTGYRVKLCEKFIEGDNFMLTYGDAVANVNINKLVSLHKNKGTIGTVTGVYPPSRFGDIIAKDDQVEEFHEKTKNLERQQPINGGFFVFKKEFFSKIPDSPDCDLERKPISTITDENQLSIYHHYGFWHCMDTYRDYLQLNEMWDENPIWKKW